MEAIGQLLAAILAFIVEVTFHALVFVLHLLLAIFSPHYRERLRGEWDTSAWKRFSIVFGVAMYTAALVIALLFWIPASFKRQPAAADAEKKHSEPIGFSEEEIQRIKDTKDIDELVDVAGGIIRRKLDEKSEGSDVDREQNHSDCR